MVVKASASGREGVVFWILLLCTYWMLCGCSQEKRLLRWRQHESYDKLLSHHLRQLKRVPSDAQIHFEAAECYRKMNRIEEALPHYRVAMEGEANEWACLRYAESLHANGEYAQARRVIATCVRGKEVAHKRHLERLRQSLALAEKISRQKTQVEVKNLRALNTAYDEYGPVYLNGALYFTSSRRGTGEHHGRALTDLYRVPTRGAVPYLDSLERLSFSQKKAHEGNLTLTKTGNKIFFARGNTGKSRSLAQVNLYYVARRRGRWSKERMVNVSSERFWDSTPFVMPDGHMIYFASDRPGGYGGTDLYSAKLSRRGYRFHSVRNLGPRINTSGNESFPYVAPNGDFYFASDGHAGLGKLDLFVLKRENNRSEVKNLGSPINSVGDDFGLCFYDYYKGFFSSNRAGGKGGDDLYTYVNRDPDLRVVKIVLKLKVLEQEADSLRHPSQRARVRLIDAMGEEIDQTYTSFGGTCAFALYKDEDYTVQAEKVNFFTSFMTLSTRHRKLSSKFNRAGVAVLNIDTTMVLMPIVLQRVIRVKNVYYASDSTRVQSSSLPTLDSLAHVLRQNPDIEIEILSHTDQHHSESYNLTLSERRAEAIVQHLITKGALVSQLRAKGYGESKPVVPRARSEAEDALNRRTEFKVLTYDKEKFILRDQQEEAE